MNPIICRQRPLPWSPPLEKPKVKMRPGRAVLSGFRASRNLPRLPRLFGSVDSGNRISSSAPRAEFQPRGMAHPSHPSSPCPASTQDFDPRLGAATSSVPQPARGHGDHLEPTQSAARSAPSVGVGHRPGLPTMPLGSSAYTPRE